MDNYIIVSITSTEMNHLFSAIGYDKIINKSGNINDIIKNSSLNILPKDKVNYLHKKWTQSVECDRVKILLEILSLHINIKISQGYKLFGNFTITNINRDYIITQTLINNSIADS
jgi:hypothetical protein